MYENSLNYSARKTTFFFYQYQENKIIKAPNKKAQIIDAIKLNVKCYKGCKANNGKNHHQVV